MIDPLFGLLRGVSAYRLIVLSAFSSLLSSCSQADGTAATTTPVLAASVIEAEAVSPAPALQRKSVITVASWYGPGFEGRHTASGEVFHQREMTAASTIIPLGSRARVTNLDNGRTVAVRINDCGPFAAGRNVDLSRAAAARLGFTQSGTKPVRIEVLDQGRRSGHRCTAHSHPRNSDSRSLKRRGNQAQA